MTKRACIFCGATPTSREHIVPDWAYEVVAQDPRGIAPDSQHARYNDAGVRQIWRSAKPVDIVAACVCKKCNHGWMSDIEVGAKEALSRMIRGEELTLDLGTQDSIAGWLGLKAIVGQYAQTPRHPVSPKWTAHYFEHRVPPLSWYIRVGRYVGDHPIRMVAGPVTYLFRHTLTPFPISERAMIFTVAIGYFFGQVLAISRQSAVPTDLRLFRQIWPHPLLRLELPPRGMADELVAWPPEGWLSDADADRYSRNVTGEPQRNA